MKSPDEIKKGLECGSKNAVTRNCNACPYAVERIMWNCQFSCMRDALALIRQLEAKVPSWISVEEGIPERGVCMQCLVYADEYTFVADWSCDRYGDDWWFYVGGEYEPLVTHWMPLPEPPKEE